VVLLFIYPLFFKFQLPTKKDPILFYSSETRDDLKKIFLTCIRSAKNHLSISSYGYSDPDVLTTLQDKQKAGLFLSIYQDAHHPCKIANETYVKKTRGLMHRKFLVLDREIVCLSSVNLTEPSLMIHNNLLAILYHPNLAKHLIDSSFYQDEQLSYYPLPKYGKEGLERILSIINTAKKTIHVGLFTFTHPELVDSLIKAKKRGVDVRIILDKQTTKAASKKAFEKLQKAEILIRKNIGGQLFHHKCALIDEKILIFGSANWTKSAFEHNDEDLFIIENLTKKHQKFFHRLFISKLS